MVARTNRSEEIYGKNTSRDMTSICLLRKVREGSWATYAIASVNGPLDVKEPPVERVCPFALRSGYT